MPIPEFPPNEEELRRFAIEHITDKAKKYAWLIEELQKAEEAEERGETSDFVPREDLMADFYRDMANIYEEAHLSKEEIEKQFSAEHLSQLSLEEYVHLLRKVPPRFIAHVKRQGIRDRISFHSGAGKYSQSFSNSIEEGSIGSVLERYLGRIVNKESVRDLLIQYLHIPQAYATRTEAEKRIWQLLNTHESLRTTSEAADVSAVHAAMDFVNDEHYGSERGNEVFFLYPTAHVASQYALSYQQFIPEKFRAEGAQQTSQFNDLWIMAKKGGAGKMPVDAAITFIPENAAVDPTTGSRYEIKEGAGVANAEQLEKMVQWTRSPEFAEIQQSLEGKEYELQEAIGRMQTMATKKESQKYPDERAEKEWADAQARLAKAKTLFQPLIDSARRAGITDSRFFAIFETDDLQQWDGFRTFISLTNKSALSTEDPMRLDSAVAGMQMQFKLAEHTIPSKEYWEQRFRKTGKRPSKVVYYEQSTPNEALAEFRRRAGLRENLHTEVDLAQMFTENIITQKGAHDRLANERELIAEFSGEILDEIYRAEN